MTLVKKPIKTGSLFVAFATKGSIPEKIITGRVTAVPLLATVFINPDTHPTIIKSNASKNDINDFVKRCSEFVEFDSVYPVTPQK